MQANRGRDTKPERRLRSLLHRKGLRFRVDVRPVRALPRRADVVFPTERVAVFVDGCYWHGCPDHGSIPRANRQYWQEKIGGNRARDKETNELLVAAGWLVLRFWEHEDAQQAVETVQGAVAKRRAALNGRRSP